MLIENADIWGHDGRCLRIDGGTITAIGTLDPAEDEQVVDAGGGLLLPGLHDHHIHLAGLAARKSSVWCGPPQIANEDGLRTTLAAAAGPGWIRGIGYHESVLGSLPDAQQLDAFVSDRPLRVQHRSGRMWLMNSLAIEELLSKANAPPGLELQDGKPTGRLFDSDEWLRRTLASSPPDLAEVSRELAAYGVTGITDMTPQNGPEMAEHFRVQIESRALVQHCTLAGGLDLADAHPGPWMLGPAKLHLHEAALPDFDDTCTFIGSAHGQGRPVAIHCVSEVELVFAIAAIEASGSHPGDRIEHASIASPGLINRMAELSLSVCVQPHFVCERGDAYLRDVETHQHPDLYRLRSFVNAGIALGGGSDAPFASPDPWQAMAAAVDRRTQGGKFISESEALSPEEALETYLSDPADLRLKRGLTAGNPADICLLTQPWSKLRGNIAVAKVVMTLASGRVIHNGVDETPFKRSARIQPLP